MIHSQIAWNTISQLLKFKIFPLAKPSDPQIACMTVIENPTTKSCHSLATPPSMIEALKIMSVLTHSTVVCWVQGHLNTTLVSLHVQKFRYYSSNERYSTGNSKKKKSCNSNAYNCKHDVYCQIHRVYPSLKCVPPIHSPPLIELAFAKFCKLSYSFISTELGNVAE